MPANEKGCAILAQWYKDAAIIHYKINEVLLLIAKIVGIKMDIKWGSLFDVLVADLVSAISAVANKIASDLANSISKMAAAMLEQIFGIILKILLASPKAIFSLVAIPHEQAKDSARKERKYLSRAQANLDRIRGIISKWTKGYSGSDYFDQITRAQPYIIRAANEAKQMIDDLDTTDQKDGFAPNAVFNRSLYSRLQNNLQAAIDITTPKSTIEKKLGLNRKIDGIQSKLFAEKEKEINADIAKRKQNVTRQYSEDMAKIGSLGDETPSLVQAAKQETIKIRYREQLTAINTMRTEQIEAARAWSKTQAVLRWKEWLGGSTFVNPAEEFLEDMKLLGQELSAFLSNVKDAYIKNLECQLLCNNIWNIRGLIRTIINEMIDYLRKVGNTASKVARTSLKAAYPLIQVTESSFNDVIQKKFEGGVSAVEMSSKLAIGNAALISADALLDAGITDSLIKLINSDDVLTDENLELNEFLSRLNNIRDWDGKIGVWAVDMQKGATTPYIQLIVDATTMVASLPILSITRNEDDQRRAQILVRNTSSVFKKLRNHNNEVSNVLDSYTPYMSEDASMLQRILAAANLLKAFAMGMSIVSLVSDILSDFGSMVFNTDMINYENCKKDYPGMFKDPDIAYYAALSRKSFPSKEFYLSIQQTSENKETFVDQAKLSIKTFNPWEDYNDQDSLRGSRA